MDGEFKLNILLGNDAMATADDVSKALVKVAARLRGRDWTDWTEKIVDDNGNTVGAWYLIHGSDEEDND